MGDNRHRTIRCDIPGCTEKVEFTFASQHTANKAARLHGWEISTHSNLYRCPTHRGVRLHAGGTVARFDNETDEIIARLYMVTHMSTDALRRLYGGTRASIARAVIRGGGRLRGGRDCEHSRQGTY